MSGACGGGTDLDELKALLIERLEELAEEVLGAPNPGTRHCREWPWDREGSRWTLRQHQRLTPWEQGLLSDVARRPRSSLKQAALAGIMDRLRGGGAGA